MADSIDVLSKAIDSLTKKVSAMGTTTPGIIKEYQSFSQKGINFEGDAVALASTIKTTRMTSQEFNHAIESAGGAFTSLGGNMTDSARMFGILSREMSDTKEAADQLKAIGYTTAEFNNLLALTVSGNKKYNLQDKASREDAYASTSRLAFEMDKLSQLTGMSRKEMEDRLKKDRDDVALQITLQQELKKGHVEASEAQKKGAVAMEAVGGKGMADLFNKLFTGMQLSEKDTEILSSLGGAGNELRDAAIAAKNASNPAEREEAERRIEKAKLAVSAQMASESFENAAKRTQGWGVQTQQEMWLANRAYREGLEQVAKTQGISVEQAAKNLSDQANNAQKQLDVSGNVVAGAATTDAYLKATSRIQDAQVKYAQLIESLNERLGIALIGSGAIKDLSNVKEGKPFSERFGGEGIDELTSGIREGKALSNFPEIFENVLKTSMEGISEIGIDAVSTATIFMNPGSVLTVQDGSKSATPPPATTPTVETPPQKFSSGTKDVFGDWFGGNFGMGTNAILHGNEAVIPKDKLDQFLTDMQSDMAPQPDMASLFNNVFNELSSMMPEQPVGLTNMINTNIKSTASLMDSLVKPTSQQLNEPEKPNTMREPQPLEKTENVTLKDVNEQLIKLNTSIVQLVKTNMEIADTSYKQIRVTKQLSPNLNTR